jgi:hypothetical protein
MGKFVDIDLKIYTFYQASNRLGEDFDTKMGSLQNLENRD